MKGEPTNKEIKDKIYDTIQHTAPEAMGTLPGRLCGYVEILSARLMACCDEKGEVFRCEGCLEIGVILRMTRAVIEKYEQ